MISINIKKVISQEIIYFPLNNKKEYIIGKVTKIVQCFKKSKVYITLHVTKKKGRHFLVHEGSLYTIIKPFKKDFNSENREVFYYE